MTSLSSNRFNKKRLTAKDEIKRIIVDMTEKILSDTLEYSDDAKEIFYLGTKILFEFVSL